MIGTVGAIVSVAMYGVTCGCSCTVTVMLVVTAS